MKGLQRKCMRPWSITAQNGDTFTAEVGRTYITGAPKDDGTVMIFSNYWVRAPLSIFQDYRDDVQ